MYFPKFVERNVQLIGLSIDSVYAHLGWVYNIYKATGIEIPFPIIADVDMKIAKKYGMISPAVSTTSTVRNVFIIDDRQIIRSILQYPRTTGRYIPEILRIIDSLQTADCEKVSTPANWLPGLPVIVPAPNTYQGLKDRLMCDKDLCCVDWYLCFKDDKKQCHGKNVMEMPMMEPNCMEKPMEMVQPLPVQVCPMPELKPMDVCPMPEVKPMEVFPMPEVKPMEVVCPPPITPIEKPVEIEKIPVQKAPVQKAPVQTAPIQTAPVKAPPVQTAPIEKQKPIKIKGKG